MPNYLKTTVYPSDASRLASFIENGCDIYIEDGKLLFTPINSKLISIRIGEFEFVEVAPEG